MDHVELKTNGLSKEQTLTIILFLDILLNEYLFLTQVDYAMET